MNGLEGVRLDLATAVLDLDAAVRAAAPGLSLVVTSGYRSPEVQARLRGMWDAGNRSGLTSRPAERSRHSDGRAVDLAFVYRGIRVPVSATPRSYFQILADFLAPYGVRWGGLFRVPSPNHYEVD